PPFPYTTLFRSHGGGTGPDVVQGHAHVQVHVRVGLGEGGRVAVERVAVQQHDRHPVGLAPLNEAAQPQRVAAAQVAVGVPETGVELHRQAAVDPGPQHV